MRRRWLVVAGLALTPVTGAAAAQVNPTLDEAERGIRRDGVQAERQLRIDALRIDARVVGRVADVSVDLTIASDSTEAYEANLALALPADAVVTGYALDVGGTMIAGQLLEQPKARNIYEDEVRAGIDPGLAEVTAGNRFTTRVFPVDAQHPRRVRVTFSAPFDPAVGLVLPLARGAAIGTVALDVAVRGYVTAPVVRFGGQTLPLSREGDGWRGSLTPERRNVTSGLAITGGTLAGPMQVAEHSSGERFFTIADSAAPVTPATRHGRLRIYWDRSYSHKREAGALEADVLARLVEATGPGAIDLVTFASDRPRVTTVRGALALRQALAGVVHRGGTSLAGLDALPLAPAERCILVFDGQVTIDRGAAFAPDCALTVLTASPEADGARLGRIAQGSGGALVRVRAGGAAEAAQALGGHRAGVVSVLAADGRRLPFRALPAHASGWLLVGRMSGSGPVRVRFSDGSERSYAGSAAVSADAPAALWAAQDVQALGDDSAKHDAMVAFARAYHVAGPAMSLLVLERPDQYLRADLAPPAGFPDDWMRDYRRAKRDADKDAAEAKGERFDFVLDQWRARKAWWSKRFVGGPRVKQERGQSNLVPPPVAMPAPMASEPSPTLSQSYAPPSPPAPPATARAPAASAAEATGDIVVTALRRRDVEVARPARNAAVKLDLADLIADRPYIAALAGAAPGARLKVLAAQERHFGSVPSFFLDTAEWFRLHGDVPTAELLLLSALELPLADDETRQIVAFRLERDRSFDRAVELTETIAAANAEFRPQPMRDLALALAARARACLEAAHGRARPEAAHGRARPETAHGRTPVNAGRADLERAFGLLTTAALNPASRDFDGIEVIALMEANALIPDIEAAGGSWSLDPRLVSLLDTDVRVVIEWTADDADIDLWVDEPNGERVYYRTKTSSAGGQISNDMTDGYGPEEYAIRRAPRGAYAVRINGYDADRINPNGPGHVLIRLTRNFARRSENGVLVDADLSFQQGRNRDRETATRPVATLTVEP